MTRFDDALDRLVDRGVLDRSQADAVRDEVGSAPAASRRRDRASSVSPLAEVAGYVGGVLTLVAMMLLVSVTLEDASNAVRALLVALLAALLVWAGAAIRDPRGRDPVRRRTSGTLWSFAVVLAGLASGFLVHEGRDAATVVAAVGGAALVLAVALYAVQRSVGQLVTMVAAGVVTLAGVATVADWDNVGGGLLVAAAGALVAAAGLARVLEPWTAAVPVGSLVVLGGVQAVAGSDEWRGVALLVGLAICLALFALATRTGVVLSGVATLGLTVAVPQAISHFAGDSAPVPLVLLGTGVVLLAGAAATARTRR